MFIFHQSMNELSVIGLLWAAAGWVLQLKGNSPTALSLWKGFGETPDLFLACWRKKICVRLWKMALIILGINNAQKGDRNCYCGGAAEFLIGIPAFYAALSCTFLCLLKHSSDIPAETRAVSCSVCDLRSLLCCHVLQQQGDDPQELTGTWASPSVLSVLCSFCQCSGREMILTSVCAAWHIKHEDCECCCKANRNN